jgi:hypothetical protein
MFRLTPVMYLQKMVEVVGYMEVHCMHMDNQGFDNCRYWLVRYLTFSLPSPARSYTVYYFSINRQLGSKRKGQAVFEYGSFYDPNALTIPGILPENPPHAINTPMRTRVIPRRNSI